jgi:hypothetical protein
MSELKKCESKFCKKYVEKIIDFGKEITRKLCNSSKLNIKDKKRAEKIILKEAT